MVNTIETYHVPVLLKESVDGLDIQADGTYVDVTFGGGGHSREILGRLGEKGHLYSFDQDADSEANIGETFRDDPRFTFVRSNFRYLANWMRYYGVEQLDGVLADLGVSSHHLDDEQRGFSFRFDAPLDMRMNKRAGMTAADIVNNYDEEQLSTLFHLYGDMRNARRVAKAIVKARDASPILTTTQFIESIDGEIGREREKKELAKVFQALRIEVNQEMEALREMLTAAIRLLRPGGRLSVITYHSVEDRIVKNMLRAGNLEGKMEQDFFGRVTSPMVPLSNKVIVPDEEEQENNPRSRSAKLRISIKQ
ncbi:MAG: 16S rRNA (cytosine(1402)-N(4))-methyltransferase RsmH [Prevotella sp.]|nr:16S rRNA (cytosine(1402)-N(4))-methyltransferase RsmH [Prevotella sp.]